VSAGAPRRLWLISALGIMQIFAWGGTFYLPAILASSIARDTGWPLVWIVGGLSIGLVVAGIVAPRVGVAIDRHGGRYVLTISCVTIAAGLVVVGTAGTLWLYILGWMMLGMGMGAGLYDAAFATLGQIYGMKARSAITALTLWGGFSSTVSWPLSAWLLEAFGWRGTCFVYAGILLLICLPMIRLALPAYVRKNRRSDPGHVSVPFVFTPREQRQKVLIMMALMFAGAIGALVSVHLILLLSGRGLSIDEAVLIGALIGPAQVGGRILEAANRERHHPLWTLTIAVGLMALGMVLLASGFAATALAIILYGAGNGILSIAKGALPLASFGVERYARVMGQLARPSLLAQALAPALIAWLITDGDPQVPLLVLALLASANVLVVAMLWRLHLRQHDTGKAISQE
jgi:predicted MFS family arabinose efflux permease